ncbi:MAG: hypothetical protein DRQ39_06285 [Gammaproteobacteria bacterium]|nr:MAG: hypothetical protein DRQ39_06285 [Gammaproteobacteria bacterium]
MQTLGTSAFTKLTQPYKTLLSKQQEEDLFRKFHETGDKKAIEQIIIAHSPIVRKAERRLSGYGMESEELISEGLEALVKAVHKYKPDADNRFSVYAYNCARFTMMSFIAKNYFDVHACTSKNNKKVFFTLKQKVAQMLETHNKHELNDEMIEELAKGYGVDTKLIVDMYSLISKGSIHLDEPMSNGQEDHQHTTKYNILLTNTLCPAELYGIMENTEFQQKIIETALANVLDHRERVIFVAQELSEKEDVKTLEVLAKEFDVSRERIRQIRNRAMEKMGAELRRIIRTSGLDSDDLFGDED